MKDKLFEQASHEYSPKQRFVALLFMAPIFLFVLPYLFIRLGARLDQWLQWPPILYLPFNLILGWLLILPVGCSPCGPFTANLPLGEERPCRSWQRRN